MVAMGCDRILCAIYWIVNSVVVDVKANDFHTYTTGRYGILRV
jgi:hypothetical protein